MSCICFCSCASSGLFSSTWTSPVSIPKRLHYGSPSHCLPSPPKAVEKLRLESSADRSSLKPQPKARVLFIPENIEVLAAPGEWLSDVARRAGVEIIESCGVGDCGTCEVMLLDEVSGDRMYIRSCITKVPNHKNLLVIDTVGDTVPPW